MPWYADLFATEAPARLGKYEESAASTAEVDVVATELALTPGAAILDLCCGQGRHLLELHRRGYRVTGVELSDWLLSRCRAAAAAEGLTPRLIRCDLREIAFDSEFDAVIMMCTSFGYLESDAEDQRVLHAIARALRPGGRVLLDLFNPIRTIRTYQPHRWARNRRGEFIMREQRYDPVTGRMHGAETALLSDGRRETRTHVVRLYTCPEITRMLATAGLELDRVLGGFDGSAYTEDAEQMVVLARKAAG